MKLDAAICYEALKSHDKRFDGKFFVAVKSTRIYCRNVCRVKLPKLTSCTFYINAAACERAGYRPCLKCRPELAPGSSPTDASSQLAFAIASRLQENNESSLEDLSNELGISSRHLRRVVESEYGVTPVELAQTQRLLMAKRLLTDTAMSVTDIAMASGFNSIRRFNTLFQERYRLKPTQLRKEGRPAKSDHLVCYIRYQSPLSWDSLMQFLKARAWPGVEHVDLDSGKYGRTVVINKHQGWLFVENLKEEEQVKVTMSLSLAPVMPQVINKIRRLFDLNASIKIIESSLHELVKPKNKGLRVPGAFDSFEMVVRVILGQQVSVQAATTLSGRLVRKFGKSIETPFAELTHLPIDATTLSQASLEDITSCGIVKTRAELIMKIAAMVSNKELDLEPGNNTKEVLDKLSKIKGIGDWTLSVISMRALCNPDAFPAGDLGIKKALNLTNIKKSAEIEALSSKWSPWRSYACFHLWKSLEEKK